MVLRNSDGTLNEVLNPFTNIGRLETDGFDFSMRYRLPLADIGIDDAGTLAFSMEGNYIDDFRRQNQPDTEIVQYAGKLRTGPENGLLPRLRTNLTTTYARDDWSLGWMVRMSSPVRVLESQIVSTGGIDKYAEIGAAYYHDAFGQFELPTAAGDVKITAGIQNVFDKKAPFTYPRGGFIFGIYDSIGRFGYLKASLGF
jgi:outer membrane receptor protein involved in Fe transport